MTLRDFFFNDINIAKQLKELNEPQAEPQSTPKTVVPNKGNINSEVNKDAPEWKIARNLTIIQRNEIVSDIRQLFSDIITDCIGEKIDELQEVLSSAQSDGDTNEINSIKRQIALLQDGFRGRKAFLKMEGHTPIDVFREIHDDFVNFQQNAKDSLDSVLYKSDISEEDKENIRKHKVQGKALDDILEKSNLSKKDQENVRVYETKGKVLDNILGNQTFEQDSLFEVLLRDACTEIDQYENVKISFERRDNTSSVQDSAEDTDAQNKSLDDDPEGDAVAGNAGWVYDARFADPNETQSYITKKILASIPILDEKGESQIDFLGMFFKYLNPKYVHAVLLDELSSMTDPRDFAYKDDEGEWVFPALTKIAQKYPWAQGVINQLEENPEYIPVFFSDFRKDFIKYWMQYFDLKEDKWKTKRLNTRSAEESMYDQIRTNFEQGIALDEDSIFKSPGTLNKEGAAKANELEKKFKDCFNSNGVLYDESYAKEAAKYATKILRIVGVDVTENAIESMLRDENHQHNVVNAVNEALEITFEIANDEKSKVTKTDISEITDSDDIVATFKYKYKEIANNIGVISPNTNVGTFRQNGKQYYSYSAPNYADTLMKDLLDDEKRQETLDSKFKSDNWFYDKEMPITDEMAEQIKEESYFENKKYKDHVVFNRSTLQWSVVPFEGNEADRIESRRYVQEMNELVQITINRMRWQNQWLYLIENDEQMRADLETKELKIIKDTKNDWPGKHNDFKDWLSAEAQTALLFEYLSQDQLSDGRLGCYNFPNFSDAGIMKFVIAPKYSIEELRHLLAGVAIQELKRMNLVARRKAAMEDPNIAPKDKPKPIQYFDKNGAKFNFFDEFNSYLVSIDESSGEYTIYDSVVDDVQADPDNGIYNMTDVLQEALANEEFDMLYDILQKAVDRSMNDKVLSFMHNVIGDVSIDDYGEARFSGSAGSRIYQVLINTGCIGRGAAQRAVKNGGKETAAEYIKRSIRSNIEEYIWNQGFATTQIIEILCKDPAFFYDSNEFQKRFKQVYAAGDRMFTGSQYGQESYDSITLTDSEMTSPSYADIAQSTAGDVKAGRLTEAERNTILNAARRINMADGQAYRSLDGMRCILDMRGQWTDAMQESYDMIKQGQWTSADLEIIWQSVKPFVYTMLDKPDGVGGMMKVPFQAKDSEFALLSAYIAIATGGNVEGNANTTVSPKLKALARFMQERGIHVAQFQSAVKVGDMANVNINFSDSKLRQWAKENDKKVGVTENDPIDTLAEAYKNYMDKQLVDGKITQKEYNSAINDMQPTEEEAYEALNNAAFPGSTKRRRANGELVMEGGTKDPQVVSTISYNDYMMQQPTPEDIIDKEVIFGSQIRTNIVADLPDDFEVTIHGKKYTKETIREIYNRTIIANLSEDFEKLKKVFGSIEKLREAIINIIDGNPKYGRDMIEALNIVEQDDGNGGKMKVFAIPLDNPSTTTKMQVIINSFFKNRITKQHIRGGACILVSSFGYSDKLRTVYNKDGSIRYFECYMPVSSKKLYEPLMEYDENGNPYLDIDKLPEGLRRAVGYRIPTEDKCSMAHLRIKGFLPQNNGSSIMLPMEAMFFSGEDFDVDKKYIMMPAFRVKRYDMQRASRDFANADSRVEKSIREYFISNESSDPDAVAFLDSLFSEDENDKTEGNTKKDKAKQAWREWWKNNKEKYKLETPIIEKIQFDTSKAPEEQSREARDNMIIDIIQAILGHRDTASKIQNPSNYLDAKRESRMYKILAEDYLIKKWAEYKGVSDVADSLLNASLDELQDFLNKFERQRSWLDPQTFVYYHKLNAQREKLRRIFYINSSQQAKYQETGLSLNEHYSFNIDDITYKRLDNIKSPLGERISRNCTALVSTTFTTDSILEDLNINDSTADVACLMIRAGVPIKQIALLLHQPIIDNWIKSKNKNRHQDLYEILKSIAIGKLNMKEAEFIQTLDSTYHLMLTTSDLMRNIVEGLKNKEANLKRNFNAATLVYNLYRCSKDLIEVSNQSKFDISRPITSSYTAEIYSHIIGVANLHKAQNIKPYFTLCGIDSCINSNITLNQGNDNIIDVLMHCRMPILQGFYSFGIETIPQLLRPYFMLYSQAFKDIIKEVDSQSDFFTLPTAAIKVLLNDIVYYYLTGTKIFGNSEGVTFWQKRQWYLTYFPHHFSTFLRNHEEIAKLSVFRQISIKNKEIIVPENDKMNNQSRDFYKQDLEKLIFGNKETRGFAKGILMYSFYKDGLNFGPQSISSLFSTKFLESVTDYIEALQNMTIEMNNINFSKYFISRFLDQFYINRIYISGIAFRIKFNSRFMNINPTNKELIINDTSILYNWKDCNSLYKYLKINYNYKTLYYKLSYQKEHTATYAPLYTTKFAKSKRLYDRSLSINELIERSKQIAPQTQY